MTEARADSVSIQVIVMFRGLKMYN